MFCKLTDTVEEVDFPFLLPHEAIDAMHESLDMKLYFGSSTISPLPWAQLTAAAQLLGCTPEAVLPMGLHGDGVPFNVGDSLEQFSFNFLGGQVRGFPQGCCSQQFPNSLW